MEQTLEQRLSAHFHHLHQHPELSNQEFETTATLTAWLKEANVRIADYSLTTGLIAEIGHGLPVVALRADIDALPIVEESECGYRSEQTGVMHACGHDFHSTVLVGAAYLLKQRESELKGTVRLLFQPAEESCDGALAFIRAGALNNVDVIFGIHNNPHLPVGSFTTRSGPFSANVDRFEIKIYGVGAHAARPENGIDPIVVAAQLVSAIQTIASRNVSGLDAAIVSVTKFIAGNTWNVIPDSVDMEGTARTQTAEIREKVRRQLERIVNGICQSFGARAEFIWHEGPPAIINSQRWSDFATAIAEQNGYQIETLRAQLGGEDFSYYLAETPGAYFNVGSASQYALHHPKYRADEAAIAPAALYLSQLAEKALQQLNLAEQVKGEAND
jgi:amidohydrolase